MSAKIVDDILFLNDKPIIKSINGGFSVAPVETQAGAFLKINFPENDGPITLQNLGAFVAAKGLGGCHLRPDTPYWFSPFGGDPTIDIKNQITWLAVAHEDNSYTFIVAIPSDNACIYMNPKPMPREKRNPTEPAFNFFGETGDAYTLVEPCVGAFIINGNNLPEIIKQAAEEVNRFKPTAVLRKDKEYPEFAKKLGWCTWNAFYQEVSAEKVLKGLQTLKDVGIEPRTLILDDGWQDVAPFKTGGNVLVGWDGNAKFGSMKEFVAKVKELTSIDTFMVWHAVCGYWQGVAKDLFPNSELADKTVLRYCDNSICDWQKGLLSSIPVDFAKFYDAYHSHLAECGIDGVKIDNQASLTFLSSGFGGRVKRFNQMREAMNQTTKKYFNNNLITCMAHAPEVFYNSMENNITRSSDDYFPNEPASHALHLYTNAMTATWFGNFLWMDWDMFLSDHATGKYHAAARAISGGPMYFADEPGKHDASVLKRTVFADGTTPRAAAPARTMTRSVFMDLMEGSAPLGLVTPFNYGTMCSFFSMVSPKEGCTQTSDCSFDIADVEELADTGKTYACWSDARQELTTIKRGDSMDMSLPPYEFELLTLSPIENGFAPIGFVNMFNTLGAIEKLEWQANGSVTMKLHGNGCFVAYTKDCPQGVLVDNNQQHFEWNNGMLSVKIAGNCDLTIQF